MIIILFCIIALLKIIILIIFCIYDHEESEKQKRRDRNQEQALLELGMCRRALENQNPNEFKFDEGTLRLTDLIGTGTFGTVSKGILKGKQAYTVAVKRINEKTSLNQELFENEQKMMRQIGQNPNILLIAGSVLTGNQELFVMEYAENGNLRDCLRSRRKFFKNLIGKSENGEEKLSEMRRTDVFCTLDLISFAYQIANGMTFIASKLIVHRNLTLHNIFLTGNNNVKIGGFQFARDLNTDGFYKMKYSEQDYQLPLWFLAPESFRDNVFSKKSDVWAFVVCLYELFTLGDSPDFGRSSNDVEKFFKNLEVQPKPEFCPDGIYELMLLCWNFDPEQRPRFSNCVETLGSYLANQNNQFLDDVNQNLRAASGYQHQLKKWME